MSLYTKRGVSAKKEEVHAATSMLDKGLFPKAFCKVYPDYLTGDEEWASVMHADGAGTKSILAYLYWKETGDLSVWRGIARDAIVMNLDDLLCVGIGSEILFSSTIDRNKNRIPGEVLREIIDGSREYFELLRNSGVNIRYMGGETADVGDLVRTIAVNGTMTARIQRNRIVTNERITAGDLIVGLASFGKASYEEEYNSGIGSNGLTSARHDILSDYYTEHFPETFDDSLSPGVVYIGKHRLTDAVALDGGGSTTAGRLLLSPTRSFAPVIKPLLDGYFDRIHGMVHCSGGGQTKCLNFLPDNVRVVKDNLMQPPEIFRLIAEASGAGNREMYQVFNMGVRMEVYVAEKDADLVIRTAADKGVAAQVIGRVEAAERKELLIHTSNGNELRFN